MSGRPNFFTILGLNPGDRWNERVFEHALNEKRALWSRQRTGIKTHPVTVEAQRNLTLVRDIERVMRDPALREKERAAARQQRVDELQRQRDRFASRAELILAKGYLYDAEAEMLLSEADTLGIDPALRRKLASAERRPVRQARDDQQRLDVGTERNLRANLAIVGEPDLYAILSKAEPGITEASSREQLTAAADALYRKARNIADKTKPEVGATQVLAGIAKMVFSSDDLVRKHAFSMMLAPLDAILQDFEETLRHVKAVDARQFETFLRKAAEAGIDTGVAREIFAAHFRDLNWSVEPPSAAAEAGLKALKACPYCGELSDPDAPRCSNCGRALRDPCPNCGAQVTAWSVACRNCGFRAGLRGEAEFWAQEAEAALKRKDLVKAADALEQAEQVWTLPSGRRDQLADRIARDRKRLKRMRAEMDKTIGDIAKLMNARNYFGARRELDALVYTWPGKGALLAECRAKIAEADRLCEEAAGGGVANDRRSDLCLHALRICADHEDARQQLAQLPPSAPTGLVIDVDEQRRIVRLSWNPATDLECDSVVVRADVPMSPDSAVAGPDRERLTITGESSWKDTKPVIGRPAYYAVYSVRQRFGTVSRRAAVTGQPVVLTTEPQFTVTPRNAEVELSWTLPANAVRLEIERDELAGNASAVRLVLALGDNRLVDRPLTNGTRYRYTAYAVFAVPAPGQPQATIRSSGVVRECTPLRPPGPPPPPYVRGEPPRPDMPTYLHRVELRWSEPPTGTITVIRVEGRTAPRAGDSFPEADLARHGLVLSGPQPLRDIWFSDMRVCSYVPVLVQDRHCYVGEARRYAAGPEVRDLRAAYDGVAVRLTWNWPAEVDEALVVWDEDNSIIDPVSARRHARVHRDSGQVAGGYEIPVRAVPRLFVQVAAVIHEDNAEYFTSGASIDIRRPSIALRYEMQQTRGFSGRRLRLVLQPERPAWLPALELRSVGTTLMRIPPGPVERELAVAVPETTASPASCILVLADPSDADWVHITRSN